MDGPPPSHPSEDMARQSPPPSHPTASKQATPIPSVHESSKQAQAPINAEHVRSPTQAKNAADILPSSSDKRAVEQDALQSPTQDVDVRITEIPGDYPLMQVAELLPAFEMIENNQENRFAIGSTPRSSAFTRPETAPVDNTSNDSFIDSIFNTGLLADATGMTPPYPLETTPSTSPVVRNQDFSPNRIRRMFEDADITETPVPDQSAQFEIQDIGKDSPTPIMT